MTLVFILGALAHADCSGTKNSTILFFDFDNSAEEVAGAKASAAEKCENFQVVKSQAQGAQVLAKLEKSGQEVPSIIFSGHHKDNMFWGSGFGMSIDQINALIDKYPKTKESMKSIFLWGCYTNNVDKLNRWLKSFPNVDYVFGYTQKSPLSKQMTGVDYLKSALKYQDQLETKTSLEDVKKFLDETLVPGQTNFHYVSAAIYGRAKCDGAEYKNFYYNIDQLEDSNRSNIDQMPAEADCPGAKEEFNSKYQAQIIKYWSGEGETLDVEDHLSKDPVINPPRMGIYPWANSVAHCFPDSSFIVDGDTKVGLGQLLNLVYWQTLKRNVLQYFKPDLDKLAASVSDREIKALIKKYKNLTRKEIIDLHARLSAINPKTKEMQAINFKIKKYLVDMDDRCADVRWLGDVPPPRMKIPKFCSEPM